MRSAVLHAVRNRAKEYSNPLSCAVGKLNASVKMMCTVKKWRNYLGVFKPGKPHRNDIFVKRGGLQRVSVSAEV